MNDTDLFYKFVRIKYNEMDTKLTLKLDKSVIEMAKKYAEEDCTGRTRIEHVIMNVNELLKVYYVDEEGDE